MKKIIFLWMILIPWVIQGQNTYFNGRYDFFNGPEVGFNGMETDYGFLVVAGTYDSLGNRGIGILSLDAKGDIIKEKAYGKMNFSFYAGGPGSLIKTTKGFAIYGAEVDSSGNSYGALYLIKKSTGILEIKKYALGDWNSGKQVKQALDGGFILTGATDVFDPLGDFWLIKTDSLGEMEWEQTYGGDNIEYGLSVDVCHDGGYIMVGESRSFGTATVTWHGGNILVVKTDSLGNQEWQRVFGNEYGDVVWNVESTSDGGYIIGGALGDSLAGAYYFRKPYLIKLDSLGNTEWTKTYGKSELGTTLRMVRELPDGSFVAAGHTLDKIGWSAGIVLKVAANGDSLWMRFHENLEAPHSSNYLLDIRPTSDGGFICTGELFPRAPDTLSSPNTIYHQDLWVLKLDSLGCSEPGCDEVTTNIAPEPIPGISIYPNPFQHLVQIKAETPEELLIEMIDLTGRIIHRETFHNQTSLSLDHLPAGIYPYRIRDKHGRQSHGKLIKE